MRHKINFITTELNYSVQRMPIANESEEVVIVQCPYSIEVKVPLIGNCKKLLQQANHLFQKQKTDKSISDARTIIGFETSGCLECIDFYFTQLERPMGPLKNNEVIRAILSCNKKYKGTRNYYFIKKVGEGGFSSVYEVRHKVNGKIYAMKLMNRAFMAQKGKIPQVILEKNIMQSIDHPFILKSYKSFATVL